MADGEIEVIPFPALRVRGQRRDTQCPVCGADLRGYVRGMFRSYGQVRKLAGQVRSACEDLRFPWIRMAQSALAGDAGALVERLQRYPTVLSEVEALCASIEDGAITEDRPRAA